MTTAERHDQRREALAVGNRKRVALAVAKRDLRSGALPLAVAMSEPPEVLRNALLIDIIRWARPPCRQSIGVIGQQAVRDGVNLMLPWRCASPDARLWVAEHGLYRWKPTR